MPTILDPLHELAAVRLSEASCNRTHGNVTVAVAALVAAVRRLVVPAFGDGLVINKNASKPKRGVS